MQPFKLRNSQRGAVIVLVAIGMGALILTAGLALDMGHAFLNKTRLQNTVDAAALAAAKELGLNDPLIVRLEGTNVEEGRRILQESGLAIRFAPTLKEAAGRAPSAVVSGMGVRAGCARRPAWAPPITRRSDCLPPRGRRARPECAVT